MIKTFKVSLFLLSIFILSPLYSDTGFVKYDRSSSKLHVFSRSFVMSVVGLWPSSAQSYDSNVAIRRHGEVVANGPINQWNIHGEYGTGENFISDVIVAVLDTGIYQHASFGSRILSGVDTVSSVISANDGDGRDLDASDPGDYLPSGENCDNGGSGSSTSSWHGSHVSGIISMNAQEESLVGVSSGARILPVRVLGSCGGTLQDVVDGLLWASGQSVSGLEVNTNIPQVINLSLGGYGNCPKSLQDVLDEIYKIDISVVVSSGNSGVDIEKVPVFPANCSGVITVGAIDDTGQKTGYSNYGSDSIVFAPGGSYSNGVISTVSAGVTVTNGDYYAEMVGTSMAAPHVAGVIANLINDFPAMPVRAIQIHLQNYYWAREDGIKYGELKEYLENLDEEQAGLLELGDSKSSSKGISASGPITNSAAGCASIGNHNSNNLMMSFILNFIIFSMCRRSLKLLEPLFVSLMTPRLSLR